MNEVFPDSLFCGNDADNTSVFDVVKKIADHYEVLAY